MEQYRVFEATLPRMSRTIRLFAQRRGVRPAAIDDVVQETFLRLLAALDVGRINHPDEPEVLVKYAVAIANAVMCKWMKEQTAGRKRGENDERRARKLAWSVPDRRIIHALTRMQHVQEYDKVLRAMSELQPLDREILYRAFVEGETCGETLATTGLTLTQYRLRKSRAKAKLLLLLRTA